MSRKRKWKSLTYKVEHLRLEVEDREETIKELEAQFTKELAGLVEGSPYGEPIVAVSTDTLDAGPANVNVVDPGELPPNVEPAKKVEDLPDDIKKLWKTIAAMTHPDKTGNDPEMTKLYLAASKAVDDGSIDEIIRVAMELDIEIPEASTAAVAKLETIAKDLQEKISHFEYSVLWQWGNANPEIKQKIMESYIAMRNLKKKEPPPSV